MKNYFYLLYYSKFDETASNQKNNVLNKYKLFFLETDDDFYFLNSNLFEKLFSQESINTQTVFMMLSHIL